MSAEEEEAIDYELSYDTDDIELDLNNQSDGSDEDVNKVSPDDSDSKGQGKPPTSVSKPYFEPRQIWTRGRAIGGRLAHRLGDRVPSQNTRGNFKRGRRGGRGVNREGNRNIQSGERRSTSKERRSVSDESRQEGKNQAGVQSEERRSSSRDKPFMTEDTASKSQDVRPRSEERMSNPEQNRTKSDDNRGPIIRIRRSKSLERGPIRGNRSRSRDRCLRGNDPGPNNRGRRSRSRGRRPFSKEKIMGRDRRSKSRDRRSKSRDRRPLSKEKIPINRDRRSKSRDRRSKSRDRRSNNRDRRSKSRDRRPLNKDKSPLSRDRRSKSRGFENRDKRSTSYTRRSRSRGRRTNSRDRQSRNRVMIRRSRSRERRSRSRERRFKSRERRSRSRSLVRKRRLSHSSSRSTSRSRDRRRRPRSYSRSKSSSSDVIAYKPKLELIDVDQYDKDRQIRELLERTNYSGNMLSGYPGQQPASGQFRQSPPTFHHPQYQVPPPPGLETYPQPSSEHVFTPAQPPAAPYISNQTPPAPFISSQTPPGPPQHMVGSSSAGPPYAPPPPPILSQPPIAPAGQFSHLSQGQSGEFGNYQQNLGGEFIPGGFSSFEGVSQPPPSFNPRQNKDFGGNWKQQAGKPQSSSIMIYPQSGSDNSNASSKVTGSRTTGKKAGVEEEKKNQKQTLVLQRDQYLQKNASLQSELSRLKEQRSELLIENSPDSERLLKENTKLQNEITQRLKAIENVVEMLSGLIKKDHPEEKDKNYMDLPSSRKDYQRSSQSPLSRHSQEIQKSYLEENNKRIDRMEEKELSRNSPKKERSPLRRHEYRNKDNDDVDIVETSPPPLIFPKLNRERSPPKIKLPLIKETKPETMKIIDLPKVESGLNLLPTNPSSVNLIHYDPELHWCSLCNIFPKTVVDYLNHLHTPNHKQQIAVLKLDTSPWHADEPSEASPAINKNAPSKRIPIRGVQFLVPSTAWYCRLCKTWIGDMHCAQEHLKGHKHTTNYSEYIAQNPHWEVDWMSDRTKSFERSSEYLSRLREKNESLEPSLNKDLESEKAKFSALSNTLLAVLAQQNKRQRQSSTSSSNTSSSEEDRKKLKKSKKKKSKKKKKKDESSPEKAHVTKSSDRSPHIPHYRHKNVEEEDSNQKSDMIADWMDVNKSELPISIKIKNKFKQGSEKPPDSRSQTERHRDSGSSKGEKFRDERMKPDDKRESRDDRFRDDRGPNRNRGRGRGQYSNRDQFNSRDQFNREQLSGRDHYNPRDQYSRRDPRDNRDLRSKNQREDSQTKKMEQQKKNLPSQRVEEQSKTDKRKSPSRVFQRPDDPLDRDSPEPVERKDKFLKNDKPQGKLWFPSKEAKEVEEEEEPATPFEKQAEESVNKKKAEVKKLTQFTIPKTKLPFIGRMPILKKKTFDSKPEETNKDSKSENPDKALIWPNIPDVKEGPELDPRKSKWDIQNPSSEDKGEPKIITLEVSPDAGDNDDSKRVSDVNLAEQDMDLTTDDQDNISWVDEGQKGDLHQDFQDALDLLFPEGDIRNETYDGGRNNKPDNSMILRTGEAKVFVGELPTYGGPPIGHSIESSGRVIPAIPSLESENALIMNLSVPPPVNVSGGPPLRNDGPILMTSMAPPQMVPGGSGSRGPGGPPQLGPAGPSQLGPGGPPHMGSGGPLSLPPGGNDMHSIMTRPPPPGASSGPPMRPSLLGPGPRGPMRPIMSGPRHMGPPMGHPVRMMGPQVMNMPMGSSLYSPEDEYDEEPVPKRKNAPSQRMRRHMQKKRAEAQAKAQPQPTPPQPPEQKKSKYEGMDRSDLAMLGIDEDDSIIT